MTNVVVASTFEGVHVYHSGHTTNITPSASDLMQQAAIHITASPAAVGNQVYICSTYKPFRHLTFGVTQTNTNVMCQFNYWNGSTWTPITNLTWMYYTTSWQSVTNDTGAAAAYFQYPGLHMVESTMSALSTMSKYSATVGGTYIGNAYWWQINVTTGGGGANAVEADVFAQGYINDRPQVIDEESTLVGSTKVMADGSRAVDSVAHPRRWTLGWNNLSSQNYKQLRWIYESDRARLLVSGYTIGGGNDHEDLDTMCVCDADVGLKVARKPGIGGHIRYEAQLGLVEE